MLNHTLLTLEVAERRGLPVAGVIVNETTPVLNTAEQTNVEELRKRIDVPLLAVVPYRATDAAELERIEWRRLAKGNSDSDLRMRHADGEFQMRPLRQPDGRRCRIPWPAGSLPALPASRRRAGRSRSGTGTDAATDAVRRRRVPIDETAVLPPPANDESSIFHEDGPTDDLFGEPKPPPLDLAAPANETTLALEPSSDPAARRRPPRSPKIRSIRRRIIPDWMKPSTPDPWRPRMERSAELPAPAPVQAPRRSSLGMMLFISLVFMPLVLYSILVTVLAILVYVNKAQVEPPPDPREDLIDTRRRPSWREEDQADSYSRSGYEAGHQTAARSVAHQTRRDHRPRPTASQGRERGTRQGQNDHCLDLAATPIACDSASSCACTSKTSRTTWPSIRWTTGSPEVGNRARAPALDGAAGRRPICVSIGGPAHLESGSGEHQERP